MEKKSVSHLKRSLAITIMFFSLVAKSDVCDNFQIHDGQTYDNLRSLADSDSGKVANQLISKQIDLTQKNEGLIKDSILKLCKAGHDESPMKLGDENLKTYHELSLNSLKLANAKTCGLLSSNQKKVYRTLRKILMKAMKQLRILVKAEYAKLPKDTVEQFIYRQSAIYKLMKELEINPLNYNLQEKLVNSLTILGNLTWGLPNTTIGALYTLAALVTAPFNGGIDFSLSPNGKQISVGTNLIFGLSAVSMGLFKIDGTGGMADSHEGGHSIQSAEWGPLYFLLVGVSYLRAGGIDHNWVEENADRNADKFPSKAFRKKDCSLLGQ
jgi:hypothetical protein